MPENGFYLFKSYLTPHLQIEIVEATRKIVRESPLFVPTMPFRGTPFGYCMTNCGDLGWVSDRTGYRYQPEHPTTQKRFPTIPARIRELAVTLAVEVGWTDFNPETCLINFYKKGETLGLHQDQSEQNLTAPIISISLGDTGIFLLGGERRTDATKKYILQSGDCLVMSSKSRNYFHGFSGIIPNTSNLLRYGGRINLTIRQVNY